jgi:hypothetical protein
MNKDFFRGRLSESGMLEDREEDEVIAIRTELAQYYVPITKSVELRFCYQSELLKVIRPCHSLGG